MKFKKQQSKKGGCNKPGLSPMRPALALNPMVDVVTVVYSCYSNIVVM